MHALVPLDPAIMDVADAVGVGGHGPIFQSTCTPSAMAARLKSSSVVASA